MVRAIAILGVLVVVTGATPAFAQMWGPRGMYGPGRMYGIGAQVGAQPAGPALTVDQAVTRARQSLGQYRNPDLVPVEIIECSSVFSVVIREKATGKGAFALLVHRWNGNVAPEMGPPGTWNTKYGPWAGGFRGHGPGMMGGGMMGWGYGPGAAGWGAGPGARPAPGAPIRPAVPPLDEARARAALQAWIAQAFPGVGIGKVVEFPGFFTYRLVRDGKTFALASVNAFGGRVWYAWHYGTVIREQAIQ
ncbi:MAG: hypothetical protein QN187_12180 [Armatimonadota bacterium]|nr:hypothetical protein [Armatimonadota bacterium]MDR7518619.1 hypothetical protein [Armatimonadota bacterium]MDR7548486.1 hypothetical protein [Armatimonadota bacterium]